MCVAVYKPAGAKLPNDADLTLMFKKNPHGGGVMVPNEDRTAVRWSKGHMTVEAWINAIHALVTVDRPAVMHVRIGTHGGNTPENTHPFPITTKLASMQMTDATFEGPVLMHNGILSIKPRQPTISDTMQFCMDAASLKLFTGDKATQQARNATVAAATMGSRLAVMWPKGTVRLFGDWKKYGGCMVSNFNWVPMKADATPRTRGVTPISGSVWEDAWERLDAKSEQKVRQVKREVSADGPILTSGAIKQAQSSRRCPVCVMPLEPLHKGKMKCKFCNIYI